MSTSDPETVRDALEAAVRGEAGAAEHLLPMVYHELRELARARLRKLGPGQTLQPTALVHEAYLRVVKDADPGWDTRGHFFGAAARAMRDILVEQARRKHALKRGGDRRRVGMDDVEPMIQPPSDDVLAVDEAVKKLEEDDPLKGQIVNLRFFARFTEAETAAALDLPVRKVEREWRYIRTWLRRELASEERD